MAITLNSNFSIGAALPIDTRFLMSKAEMLAASDSVFPEYLITMCSDDGKPYVYNKNATANAETGKFSVLTTDSKDIQVSTLPTAGADELNNIYQYIGETDTAYTQGHWYICKEDGGTYSWETIDTQDAVGSVDEDIEANIEVGGVAIGDVIAEGTNITDVLKKLLVKYFPPTITLTSTPANKVVEIGETVNVTLSAAVGKKSKAITAVAFYKDDTELESVTSGVDAGGTFTHSVADGITTNTTFKATATDGDKVTESKVTYTFVNPIFTGSASDSAAIDITTLTKKVETKGAKKYTYNANNEYLIFAYPSSYGTIKSIVDQNGFDNTSSWSTDTTTANGVAYTVKYTTTKVTCSNFAYNFTFN